MQMSRDYGVNYALSNMGLEVAVWRSTLMVQQGERELLPQRSSSFVKMEKRISEGLWIWT